MDNQTSTYMDNQTSIWTIRHIYVQSDKCMYNQTNIWTIRKIYGQSDKYMDNQTSIIEKSLQEKVLTICLNKKVKTVTNSVSKHVFLLITKFYKNFCAKLYC